MRDIDRILLSLFLLGASITLPRCTGAVAARQGAAGDRTGGGAKPEHQRPIGTDLLA